MEKYYILKESQRLEFLEIGQKINSNVICQLNVIDKENNKLTINNGTEQEILDFVARIKQEGIVL